MKNPLALTAVLVLAGCKTAPEVQPIAEPELTSQELQIAEQDLTDYRVRFVGQLAAPGGATVEKATYEMVVEEKVVKSGEVPLGLSIEPGQTGEVRLEETGRYVGSAEELKEMSSRGGALLTALRGKLHLRVGGRPLELPFARARDIRVPRLPHVKLHDLDAARFSAEEANAMFYVGVVNPNPFTIRINGVSYTLTIGGKQVSQGTIGKGEKIGPAATGVFETQVVVNQESYGPEVVGLIKSLKLPYLMAGALTGELVDEPYELKGEIKLNVSK